MQHEDYDPLDILTTPKPLTYRLNKYKVRRSAQQKLQFESDYTKKPSDAPGLNAVGIRAHNLILRRHLRKKKFEKEILSRWKCERRPINFKIDTEFDQPVNFVDWESAIVYDPDESNPEGKKECTRPCNARSENPGNEDAGAIADEESKAIERDNNLAIFKSTKEIELIRSIFNNDCWESQIIYDEKDLPNLKTYVTININDPNLILDKTDKKNIKKAKQETKKNSYNISNDKYYETQSVKSNLGNLGMQHSLPALQLDMALYRTFLDKEELRMFHRPALRFVGKVEKVRFSSLRQKGPQQNIKNVHQLTLTDEASFSLFEYSEEIPLLVQKNGMVSFLTTYYKNNGATPRKFLGKLTVVENEDPAPFIVSLKPGVSVTALTNNLFKACIFKHAASDYLMIVRDESEAATEKDGDLEEVGMASEARATRSRRRPFNSYIRKIENVFSVGQTFPLEEVYSPHSRKFNIFCKNRLKVAAFREYQENGLFGASYIEDLFPQFSEGSKRKWLREYSDSFKRGKETMYQLTKGTSVLSEEDLRALVTPENVCQYEAMLCAEQRLRDCGLEYKENVMEEGELLLMPWNLSRNFTNFVGGRGILEMRGPGDPTGIGEGFSFLKANAKLEDPEVIWDREQRSLSSSREISYDEVKGLIDERERKKPVQPVKPVVESSLYIVITRVIDDEEETEKVTDPQVIKAYLKQRKKIRHEERKGTPKNVLRCGACGIVGHMKTNKSCPNFCQRALKGTSTAKKAKNLLTDLINKTLQQCTTMSYASAFLRPVSAKKFPDYPKIVSDPIDLGTIKSKSKNHRYCNFRSFVQDLEKMWKNCMMYNGTEHGLSKLARSMVELGNEVMASKNEELREIESVITKGESETTVSEA